MGTGVRHMPTLHQGCVDVELTNEQASPLPLHGLWSGSGFFKSQESLLKNQVSGSYPQNS